MFPLVETFIFPASKMGLFILRKVFTKAKFLFQVSRYIHKMKSKQKKILTFFFENPETVHIKFLRN